MTSKICLYDHPLVLEKLSRKLAEGSDLLFVEDLKNIHVKIILQKNIANWKAWKIVRFKFWPKFWKI